MLKRIKANLVFSVGLHDMIKSVWIGPLLITWYWNEIGKRVKDFDYHWYGWNYWMPQEVEFEK